MTCSGKSGCKMGLPNFHQDLQKEFEAEGFFDGA